MKELGSILRTARESKGLTLDEIQERTKIRKRYLEAIEEGELSILPGLVYARGFIRNYAEQVGLDGQALLQEHGLSEDSPAAAPERAKPVPKEAEKKEKPQPKIASPDLGEGNRIFPQVAMAVAVIGLLGVGLWYLTNREASPQTPAPQAPQAPQQTTPPAQQPAVPTPPPQPKPAEPLKAETKGNGKSVYKVEGDKIKLELQTANGDCWLEIVVDGERKFYKVAAKGTTLTFEGTKEVLVVSGNSPALTVKVNDLPVELEQVNGPYQFLFQKK
ncbi:helix-turn-helix domain-containing protein [Effusibacillus consociatus]|uniref:Helix-turn-helix domain-containing protein n=1 Tax=Effusibacillus consociatus TaxID=1117041 RepID=A0ABV9PZ96_9BACL